MKSLIGLIILAAAVLTAMMYFGVQVVGTPAPKRIVSERLLIEDFSSIGRVTISPDGRRVAYIGESGVVVDGIAGKQYVAVPADSLIFSPDSQRLAYTARIGNKWSVVLDGVEGKLYDGIGERGIRHRYELVAHGPIPLFSPDSQRLAYAAKLSNKVFMVVDGVEGKHYDEIRRPVFSPDSRRMVYTARIGNKWSVVLDGVEGKQYDFARSIIFSPDSQRLAYWTKIGNTQFIVVDGVEGKAQDDIRDTNLTFSPDSKQVAYTARIGNKWSVVLDGIEGKLYDFVHEFSLAFSPDSQRLAYVTGRFVVVHGIEETPDKHGMYDVIFSPDSKHMAYIASREKFFGGTMQWVVVDGAAGKRYDHVGPPAFSPDSRHVAYAAYKDRKWFVVVDGAKGKPYDRMFNPGYNYWAIGRVRIIFDSPDSFHYLALKGDSIYLVEETIR